ncbi:aminoglycoside phosphotransferase family protein [Promicromonospora iranensis]|uniref:Streptomycin 6-kinase n=1 Tax=Promicromonospora iranensis TaxID=1105144 RepID=A0ABU2CUE4_9MICO|nr:aminoglycoside phosphotransferase family protein [Promicromonospora iranensis]MDR7384967.1 streptomycin 6-kinase [Promicromonospora iranensis]
MASNHLTVPELFAARTVEREQDAGQAWIDQLPQLAEQLLCEWGLTLVGPPVAGNVGLVWEVRRADGTPAVLKVSWRDAETRNEAEALRRWDGRGAVRLIQASGDAGALLMERLDAGTSLSAAPMSVAITAAAELLRVLHVPEWSGFDEALELESRMTAPGEKYRERLRELRADVEHAFRSAPHVLLHGDFHYENVLRRGATWKAIDPKPTHGPGEWDLLPLLRNRFDELPRGPRQPAGIRDRLDSLIAATGSDPGRAYLFARYRALRDADYADRVGDTGFGAVATAIAEAVSRS